MKTFKTLTAKDAHNVYKGIYGNAVRLQKDAKAVVKMNKSFATATSLLILSLEEQIKAIIVLLHSKGYKVYSIKDIKLVFTRHEFRHWVAQFLCVTKQVIEFDNLFIKNKKTYFLGTFINSIISIFKVVRNTITETNNYKNLENFNDYKNNGFYVDYRNEIITPTTQITQIEYQQVINVHKSINQLFTKLEVFFNYTPESIEDDINYKKKKEDLKLLIDNALKDFSLKDIKKETK